MRYTYLTHTSYQEICGLYVKLRKNVTVKPQVFGIREAHTFIGINGGDDETFL